MEIQKETVIGREGHFMLKISVSLLGLIGTLLISYFIWSSNTLLSLDKNVGVLSSKMETYIKTLEIYAANQYTKKEAESDKALFRYRLDTISERLEKLEAKK